MKIYGSPGSAIMAPMAMLEHIGCGYEWVPVDLKTGAHRTPEFLALNPKGRVPVLTDGDFALTESAAICLYLAERFPQSGLLPAPGTHERARAYEWLFYLSNTVQVALLDWWHSDWLTKDADAQDAIKAGAEIRLAACFDVIDGKLAAAGRPHCLGANLSAADFFLHMVARWSRYLEKPAYAYPAIKRATDAARAEPAIRRMMEKLALAEA
jgi:glutathione S-transferase